jgi:hypothetical protein
MTIIHHYITGAAGIKFVICLRNVDDTVLIGKNQVEIKHLFAEMENVARKLQLQINQEKTKYMIAERENILKQNKIVHLKIKITNYKDR